MQMQTHVIPNLLWKRVAMDILTYKKKDYLITVDYYSDYWEFDEVSDMGTETIVETVKKNFSRFGVPTTVVRDNSTTFTSLQFIKFAQDWDFQHVTSSPYHARGNGKVELSVEIAKTLLKKFMRTNQTYGSLY